MAELPPPEPAPQSGGVPDGVGNDQILAAAERVLQQSPDRPADTGAAVPDPLEQAAEAVDPVNVVHGATAEVVTFAGRASGTGERMAAYRRAVAGQRVRRAMSGNGFGQQQPPPGSGGPSPQPPQTA